LKFQAAVTASRHVFIAAAREVRCVCSGGEVALDVEGVEDGGMSGEKSLS
jgi:hypothetical protein